jgi:hypothetical protein
MANILMERRAALDSPLLESNRMTSVFECPLAVSAGFQFWRRVVVVDLAVEDDDEPATLRAHGW